MADLQLRRLERKVAAWDDPQARVRQIVGLVRAGHLPLENVHLAAKLGSPTALEIVGTPVVLIDCFYCKGRRERWEADTRRYKEPLPVCLKCRNTYKCHFDGDLIRFVKQVTSVPIRTLVAWACDCAERAWVLRVPRKFQMPTWSRRENTGEDRDTILENVILHAREWLKEGDPNALIYQVANAGGPAATISRAIAQGHLEGFDQGIRRNVADLISSAWDGSREERHWQRDRLIHYLLS